jgi:hypothetical protein
MTMTILRFQLNALVQVRCLKFLGNKIIYSTIFLCLIAYIIYFNFIEPIDATITVETETTTEQTTTEETTTEQT